MTFPIFFFEGGRYTFPDIPDTIVSADIVRQECQVNHLVLLTQGEFGS